MVKLRQNFIDNICKRKDIRKRMRSEFFLLLQNSLRENDLDYFSEILDIPGIDSETLDWLVRFKLNPVILPDEILLKIINLLDLSSSFGLDTVRRLAYPLSRTQNPKIHAYLSAYLPYLAASNPYAPRTDRMPFATDFFILDRFWAHTVDDEKFFRTFVDLANENTGKMKDACTLVSARSGLPLHSRTVEAYWKLLPEKDTVRALCSNNRKLTAHLYTGFSAFYDTPRTTILEILAKFPITENMRYDSIYMSSFYAFENLDKDLAIECFVQQWRRYRGSPNSHVLISPIGDELIARKYITGDGIIALQKQILAAEELVK